MHTSMNLVTRYQCIILHNSTINGEWLVRLTLTVYSKQLSRTSSFSSNSSLSSSMSVKGSDSPALSALSSGCGSTELLSSGTHIETASSVPNKGGVLISGVVLYTPKILNWDHAWCPSRYLHFRGVSIERVPLYYHSTCRKMLAGTKYCILEPH